MHNSMPFSHRLQGSTSAQLQEKKLDAPREMSPLKPWKLCLPCLPTTTLNLGLLFCTREQTSTLVPRPTQVVCAVEGAISQPTDQAHTSAVSVLYKLQKHSLQACLPQCDRNNERKPTNQVCFVLRTVASCQIFLQFFLSTDNAWFVVQACK